MFKNLRSPGLTRSLMEHLTNPLYPRPQQVAELLDSGARAWAVAAPAAEGIPGRSIFYLIQLRTPEAQCLDAWFNRAGSLAGEPWRAHGTPNPFHELIQSSSQPEIFTARLVARLLDAGLVPTAPEGQRMGPWLQKHCQDSLPGMLRAIGQHCPKALLDPSHWDENQRATPAFAEALQDASVAVEQESVAPRPPRPGR